MEKSGKESMTEEERHALALKLDEDLEAFINSREKQPYTEGWKESEWEKVIVYNILKLCVSFKYYFSVKQIFRRWSSTPFL